jgi:hypothetical protein
MKRLLVGLFLALPFAALADGGTFTVTQGTTQTVVAAVSDPRGLRDVANWTNGYAYSVGTVAKIGGIPYQVTVAGTSGAVSPAGGAEVVVDNSVTWLMLHSTRKAVVVQRVSGGTATVYIAKGPIVLIQDGASIAISNPDCYSGEISVAASGTNVVINTVLW